MIEALLTLTGFLTCLGVVWAIGLAMGLWLAVPVLVNEDEDDTENSSS
jgi:hypothetical protein